MKNISMHKFSDDPARTFWDVFVHIDGKPAGLGILERKRFIELDGKLNVTASGYMYRADVGSDTETFECMDDAIEWITNQIN